MAEANAAAAPAPPPRHVPIAVASAAAALPQAEPMEADAKPSAVKRRQDGSTDDV